MIAPQELRLGNLIKTLEGVFEVKTVNPSFVSLSNGTIATLPALSPIDLTEEWLLKFGFEKNNGIWFIENFLSYFTKFTNESGLYVFFVGRISISKIKYVHQLQNLYYVLTGEELTIK